MNRKALLAKLANHDRDDAIFRLGRSLTLDQLREAYAMNDKDMLHCMASSLTDSELTEFFVNRSWTRSL